MSPISRSPVSERRAYLVVIAIIMLTAAAVMSILSFANGQYNRSVDDWQVRLNLIADSRAKDVQGWVERQFAELSGLANNASLQLYVTAPETTDNLEAGFSDQQIYLRHLLTLTAERSGFTAPKTAEIPANVAAVGTAGIAILNNNGNIIAATPDMPPLDGGLAEFVAQSRKGVQSLYDIRRAGDGTLQIGFLVPVYAVQGEAVASEQIGSILGVKIVDESLFSLLKHPGTTEKTLQGVLVRKNGTMVEVINPSSFEATPLSFRTEHAPAKWAESAAIERPATFGVLPSASQQTVLFTSRTIDGTLWVLVEEIDKKEALAAANASRSQLLTILFVSLAAVIAVVIAAWRHGSSRHSAQLAASLGDALREGRLREALLRLITNTQPGAIFLTGEDNRVQYANSEAVENSGSADASDLIGKDLSNVLGKGKAEEYIRHSTEALDTGKPIVWTRRDKAAEEAQILLVHHLPVEDIEFDTQPVPGVLIIEEDITQVVLERERRERTLQQLTASLVKMVDQRDPNAADHSRTVALLAKHIALEMRLDDVLVETAETAGRLMNIGKITVSSEVLTRKSALNASEKLSIQHSLAASATLIEDVEFNGPVIETLRQSAEHFDGSGLSGLKANEILVTARIIAVANAFTGMASIRAYRKAIPVDQIIDQLMEKSGKEFDRKVVVALASFIENHGGHALFTH